MENLLPRVPRERRLDFILDMVEILVCQGLADVPEDSYESIAEALCEIVRKREPLEEDPELPELEPDEADGAPCPAGG